ncbi:hypothetical protein Lal_00027171 [Lupinus albus]|nr:hypothetical protein Lal_00027171 [Lupinus albus]
MSSSGVGRYMPFPPSPSPSAPLSPHLTGLRSLSTTALAEQDKYLTELLGERHKLSPFMAVLPNCYRLLNQVNSGAIAFSRAEGSCNMKLSSGAAVLAAFAV